MSVVDNPPHKKKFKMPDIYVVLAIFILFAAFLTYVIPAGKYERELKQTEHGMQNMVLPGTYKKVEQSPVGFFDVVSAIPDGLKRAASIVFLTFMVGGCMGLIKRAGLIDLGVQLLTKGVGNKEFLVIPILMAIFTTLAAFIGVPELSLAYLPVLLPLFYRLGYDGMTATAVAMLGPCMGFTFGLTIPGSVGVGQEIAQLEMFSGYAFRAVVLCAVMVSSIVYVMWYARKVKSNPNLSLSLDTDAPLRANLKAEDAARGEVNYTNRQKIAGGSSLLMFAIAIFLILKYKLAFEQMGGLFLFIGITAAVITGKKVQEICNDLNAGMRDMMVAALLCGIASAIAVVMDKGVITDTLVFWLESMLHGVPASFTAIAIFWEQSIFNFLIPGATALTVLTMPILSPLAQLLDVQQQAVVSANAWGGQVTDIFFPTSGFFVATLAIAKIDYVKWIRFYTPLLLVIGTISCIALFCMQTFQVGL